MIVDRRLMICAAVSVAAHVALSHGLDHLPPRDDHRPPQIVQVRMIEPAKPEPIPEPPPEPPRPPEPVKPEPLRQLHERPRPHAPEAAPRDTPPVDTPPVDHAPTVDTTTTPAFGVTMESTSQAGNGPAMAVGNTTHPAPAAAPGTAVKPLAAPVAAVEVTRMPLPLGRCAGKYTDEARTAAVEGVVVLDLIVDEHGRVRDISVVEGLPHGLTQAAIAALVACSFTPGEKDGHPVPVRLRGFKIRFLLQDGQ